MKASMRTVPMASKSKNCCLVALLASEERPLIGPLCALCSDDGPECECWILYLSDEFEENTEGTAWDEKLRNGTLGHGASGPVELRLRPW